MNEQVDLGLSWPHMYKAPISHDMTNFKIFIFFFILTIKKTNKQKQTNKHLTEFSSRVQI